MNPLDALRQMMVTVLGREPVGCAVSEAAVRDVVARITADAQHSEEKPPAKFRLPGTLLEYWRAWHGKASKATPSGS